VNENIHPRLVGTVILVVVLLWLSALLTQAGAGGTTKKTVAATPTPTPTPTGPAIASSGKATVFLLGGSSARESIVSNSAWSKQLSRVAHAKVRAYDLGARNETFAQDMGLVKKMPKGPNLVLIGLTVGRYTPLPSQSAPPLALLSAGAEVKHQYATPLSSSTKQRLVDRWVSDRYPVFQQNFAHNADRLDQLVKLVLQRKFHPVLLQLPLNLQAVGSAFDRPRAKYQSDARRLAAKYKIPYLDFLKEVKLPSSTFYDLFHLVPPGRQQWQTHLSEEVTSLLVADKLVAGK
jgi:hypothetical protein